MLISCYEYYSLKNTPPLLCSFNDAFSKSYSDKWDVDLDDELEGVRKAVVFRYFK
jgi:hypothetical protein